MDRILFAWIGHTDLRVAASWSEGEGQLGPIGQVVTTGDYSEVVLLDNYKNLEGNEYLEWFAEQTKTPLESVKADLENPMDFSAIYRIAASVVEKKMKEVGRLAVPVFHLSPGTPAMAAVWILLSKGRFPSAKLVRSSLEQGVEDVELPFDIATEFVPSLVRAADEKIVMLGAGLPEAAPEFEQIIYRCAAMQEAVAKARLAAMRDVPVLIEGETGTGKELFARAIHEASQRKNGPFVPVNCGAIPRELLESEFFGHTRNAFSGADREREGFFEAANRGTLFLDELGELPLEAQVKILRILQDGRIRRLGETRERPINVRIIAATNRDLVQEVADGRFRADLFYRMAVAVIRLPALREREGDVGLLVGKLLDKINSELASSPGYIYKKLSVKAKNLMIQHRWPGNARELQNTLMRICVWCQGAIIGPDDVRQAILPSTSSGKDDILSRPLGGGFNIQELQAFLSSHYIRRALEEAGGNKRKAASLLGLKNYQTLNNWIEKYGVDV